MIIKIFTSGLLVILVSFIFTGNLKAQTIPETELAILDSLLIQEDSLAIVQFFEGDHELARMVIELDTAYNKPGKIRDRYLNLVSSIRKIKTFTMKDMDIRLNGYKNYEKYFNEHLVGEASHQYYQSYLREFEKGNLVLAVKYYFLAQNRKFWHSVELQKITRLKIKEIETALAMKDYLAAEFMLKDFNDYTRNIPLDKEIQLHVEYLNELVDKHILDAELKDKMKTQRRNLNNGYTIGVSSSSLLHSSTISDDQIWAFRVKNSSAIDYFETDQVKFGGNYSLGIALSRYMTDRINLLLGYNYGKMKLNTHLTTSLLSYDFSYKYHWIILDANYYFKKTIGFRPFAGIGFTTIFIPQKNVKIHEKTLTIGNKAETDINTTIPQITATLGAEYIPDQDSKYAIQVYAKSCYSLNEADLMGKFGIEAGLRINILLRTDFSGLK